MSPLERWKDVTLLNLTYQIMPAYEGRDALDNQDPRQRLLSLLEAREVRQTQRRETQ